MIQNNKRIEPLRVTKGRGSSDASYGNNGYFVLRTGTVMLKILASDSIGWEHVSVSVHGKKRCPTWEEMCLVKDLFWGEDECVVQYHPPLSDYINMHEYVLHLWKPIDVALPHPPSSAIGWVRKEDR